MSSESAEYLTPPWILDLVEKVAPIGLDPCAHVKSEAYVRSRATIIGSGDLGGLVANWLSMLDPPLLDQGVNPRRCPCPLHHVGPCTATTRNLATKLDLVFVNPPYGRALKDWAAKMAAEKHCTIIALVPARVDTAWWRELDPSAWCALAGRVKFLSLPHKWREIGIKPGRDAISYTCVLCGLTTEDPLKHASCNSADPTETDPAPFPSAVCLLHARPGSGVFSRFIEAFKDKGPIYQRVQQ